MRNLQTQDVFAFVRLIDKVGIKDELKTLVMSKDIFDKVIAEEPIDSAVESVKLSNTIEIVSIQFDLPLLFALTAKMMTTKIIINSISICPPEAR